MDQKTGGSPLTHDYLVHSLRDWLTRKQRETRRGRAELRLAERHPLERQAREPAPAVRLGVGEHPAADEKKDWTKPQRKMMKRAGRLHGLRTLGLVMLFSLITWAGIEGYGTLRASALVESLQKVDTPDLPATSGKARWYRRWADPR